MNNLPFIIDAEEAIEFYCDNPNTTDAVRAYIVGLLKKENYSNPQIRRVLAIKKVYTVTHLSRVGLSLSVSELTLWHNNPHRITLGHVRAVSQLSPSKREKLLRNQLAKKLSVRQFERIAKNEEPSQDADIERYQEMMGNVLGKPIKIRYDTNARSGDLTIRYFGLDDLDSLSKALGFDPKVHL